MPAYARAKRGVLLRRLLEVVERAAQARFAALLEEVAAAQIEIVRLRDRSCRGCSRRRSSPAAALVRRARRRGAARRQFGRDRGDDRRRDLVLHAENVLRIALEHVGPDGEAVGRVHESRRDAQASLVALHRSGEHHRRAQRFADVGRARGLIALGAFRRRWRRAVRESGSARSSARRSCRRRSTRRSCRG